MSAELDWLAGLRTRIADLASGRASAAAPRDAATVLLLRDGADGLEVFLVRRSRGMAFAAGQYAFPGGSTEPRDDEWPAALPHGWADSLAGGDEALARRLVGAAVRETREECGVELSVDGLRPWAHWITPAVERRRFDTRFFLAALPAGQHAEVVGGEADEGRWLRPADAAGLPMLPPTEHALAELAGFAAVADALAAVRAITPVLPVVRLGAGGEVELVLPWHEGYPAR